MMTKATANRDMYEDGASGIAKTTLENFSELEYLVLCRFTKATVASILPSLSLAESASILGPPPSPMLQLLGRQALVEQETLNVWATVSGTHGGETALKMANVGGTP
ncbi:hypothetical protein HPB47_026173 [Ixodes persulcatus]|uniref:Uncharacterized protein n=1 Tax=Ixodes persulcatus TaxID=34615 RepID=A0AC60PZJ3_IXOPE|nr:hypothetical protein HPB47_026173 [Ixodes persulcatus]